MSNEEETTMPAGINNWRKQWLQLLKSMHEEAWSELVVNYGDDLRSDIGASLRKRGLSLEMVEDVEQETWRIAVQKIHEFEAETVDKLYNWLRVIALNRVRMILRKQKDDEVAFEDIEEREAEGGFSLDHFIYMHELSEDSPEALVLLRERLAALEVALHDLSPRDREILLRRLLGDETPRDLAVVYDLAPRSVSMILLRAKQTLEKRLRTMESSNHERNHDG